ncbi:MAG: family transposase [Frankiales bacterium]|nr:family transposase [Frankiales bacterium]
MPYKDRSKSRRVERSGRVPSGTRPSRLDRECFFALLAGGMSVVQASAEVGINARTGRDWRRGVLKTGTGTRVYPDRPVVVAANFGFGKAISARYLSEDERVVIADLHRAGRGVRQIAAELGRQPSTVSRELTRNAHPDSGDYRPHAAQRRSAARRSRPKQGKLAASPALREAVQDCLSRLKWSPEQISAHLARQHPQDQAMNVSHETIYQALYLQGRGELRRELTTCLRTGRAVRKPRRQPGQRQSRFIDPMLMISERPAEADDRAVPGHWEGDLIVGPGHLSAIGTLVERTTRFLMLVHLPVDHTGESMRDGLVATMQTLPEQLRRSLTWDQGCEMSRHRDVTIATDMPVYFCDPASPWQRGSNENTNGLLRQFFPKGQDLRQFSADDLTEVAHLMNTRPRKTLGWETPAQRLAALLA